MRVPIPVVILLILAVVAGLWWHGTKDKDFVTPPSARKLVEIRTRVESSFPQTEKVDDAISEPVVPVEPPKPVVVEPRQVARLDPAVDEGLGGGFRLVPVELAVVGPLDPQLAHQTCGHRPSLFITELHVERGQWRSDKRFCVFRHVGQ